MKNECDDDFEIRRDTYSHREEELIGVAVGIIVFFMGLAVAYVFAQY